MEELYSKILKIYKEENYKPFIILTGQAMADILNKMNGLSYLENIDNYGTEFLYVPSGYIGKYKKIPVYILPEK